MAAISSLVSTPSKPQVKPPMPVEIPPQNNLKHLLGKLAESRSSLQSDNVAYFVAHDLRHHLCTIYANAELMCSTRYTLSDREEMLEDISSAVTCMTEILDSFLLHSKNGYMFDFRLEPLSLLIEKAAQMVKSHPDAYNVEFIHDDLPFVEVHADSTWLSSAIFNLLLNACQAVQFAPESKKVRVECHQDQKHVCIRITDSGPGVPQAIREHLFQPFVRVRRSKGTGLGLAIVKSVVREHGGEVYLEESNPGNTSFVVRLPTINAATMDAFPRRLTQQ
jgi:signal transduction histidine kinase